jgi:hypothetical protein
MADFTRTFKGGSGRYVCKNVITGDTLTIPAGFMVVDVVVERVNAFDVPTAGGDALDALILGDVITSTADFTTVNTKKATLGVGAISTTGVAAVKTFTKTDANANTTFNCYVCMQKYR